MWCQWQPAGVRGLQAQESRVAESMPTRSSHLLSPVHRIEDRQVDVVVALYRRDRGHRRNHQKEGTHDEASGAGGQVGVPSPLQPSAIGPVDGLLPMQR